MLSKKTLAIAASTATIFLGSVAPALASTTVVISGNGADSNNRVNFTSRNTTTIRQTNNADISNNIHVISNTGGNTANKNTGGDVSIRTGNSNVDVNVSNRANSNVVFGFGGSSSGNFSGKGNFTVSGNFNNKDNHRDDNKNHDKDFDNKDSHNKNFKTRGDCSDFGTFRTFTTTLKGRNEVPGPGDRDAWGTATVRVNTRTDQVCTWMQVHNIAPATAAHIHWGSFGVAGPIVVTLPTPNSNGWASGCMSISHTLAVNLVNHPSSYYVNVHNAHFPDGAMRGQL
ncbi:MAG TPA: CHRD domain-containing protein [Candidatus Saccharimonadales bacterium]|nr:CHRD domain-containing protein [Candidatus Saccharimonadales bacterium]